MGMTQQQIADRLNVKMELWRDWENGWTLADVEIAAGFCDRYGFTLDWIYRNKLWAENKQIMNALNEAIEEHGADWRKYTPKRGRPPGTRRRLS